jgi:hypothetical protein
LERCPEIGVDKEIKKKGGGKKRKGKQKGGDKRYIEGRGRL